MDLRGEARLQPARQRVTSVRQSVQKSEECENVNESVS